MACLCISKDENEADQVCKNAFSAAFPTVMKKNLSPMKLCDRDKRDVHFSDDPTEEDFHIFKETASQLQPRFRRAVQPGYMSKDNATRYCEERISETEIGKLCVKIGVNVQGLVEACAADIVVRKKTGLVLALMRIERIRIKLGRDVAPYEIYQSVHIFMLLSQHVRFQSPLQNQILPFVAAGGQNID